MDDSAIICDEVIESYDEDADVETKSNDETNFNLKKATCRIQSFHILLISLLITIASLIALSIYCYLIKYQPKLKHLLPFHFTNKKLKI